MRPDSVPMLKIVLNDAPIFPGPPACCVGIDSVMVLSVARPRVVRPINPSSGPEGRGLPSLLPIFDSTLESGHTEPAVFPIFPISVPAGPSDDRAVAAGSTQTPSVVSRNSA